MCQPSILPLSCVSNSTFIKNYQKFILAGPGLSQLLYTYALQVFLRVSTLYKSVFTIAHVFSIVTALTLSGVDLVITYKNPPQPPELCLYFTLAPSDHSFAFSTRVFITCLPSEKLNEMLSIVDELVEVLLYYSLIILRSEMHTCLQLFLQQFILSPFLFTNLYWNYIGRDCKEIMWAELCLVKHVL